MSKVAITNLYSNTVYGMHDQRSIETSCFMSLLEELGHEVNLIGDTGGVSKKYDFYVKWNKIDLNDYEKIFIQLSPTNFFGGNASPRAHHYVSAFPEYRGKIYFLLNDPSILPTNPAIELSRFQDHSKYVEDWKRILDEAIYVFPGKDVSKFVNHVPKNVLYFDWFSYIMKKQLSKRSEPLFPSDKKYDVCYFGDNRRKYMTPITKNLLIGYESDIEATKVDKQNHLDMMGMIDSSRTSLVIGDEEHNGNVKTFSSTKF